jgi:hypothetical protein
MQRQLRLGDVLDDYCPRERRLTNHVIVAMVGDVVKHTRCTTCDADHDYKHAKVPRQRKKTDTPAALYAAVAAGAPKRVTHDADFEGEMSEAPGDDAAVPAEPVGAGSAGSAGSNDTPPSDGNGGIIAAPGDEPADVAGDEPEDEAGNVEQPKEEEGPAHRRLIRASLPRSEGQAPPSRPIPEFTIRQPAGRQNRFRPRPQGGGQQFFGNNRSGGAGGTGGGPRQGNGRPQYPSQGMPSRQARRDGPGGRRRPK